MSPKILTMVSVCFLVSGCAANLNVASYKNVPQDGIVYALPMAQFEVKIIRRISECGANGMKVVTKFDVKKKLVEDPDHLYVIDPKSLSTFFNSSSVEVQFHEDTRTLKSLNAAVDDKAGPAAITAIKIAGAAFGIPAPPGGRALACNTATNIPQKVARANSEIDALKKLTLQLDAQTVKVTELVAAHKLAMPGSDPLLDRTIKREYGHLVNLKKAISSKQKVVAASLKPISHTSKMIIWPKKGNDLDQSDANLLPPKVMADWVGGAPGPAQRRAFEVFLSLKSDSKLIGRQNTVNEVFKASGSGLFYRTPVRGKLIFSTHSDPKVAPGHAKHKYKTIDTHPDQGYFRTSYRSKGIAVYAAYSR